MVGYTGLTGTSIKILMREKALRGHRDMTGYAQVIDALFIYHFVDPDLRIVIFFERVGATE